jgi:hypothetical protein
MPLFLLAVTTAMQPPLRAQLSGVLRRLVQLSVVLARDYLGLFLALVALLAVCWFFAGWRLRGWRLLLWDLILPLLAVALICVLGPGRLFPKVPYEGPHLITFSSTHSLTLLDLPGFASAALAVVLACGLLLTRWRERGRRQRRVRRIA